MVKSRNSRKCLHNKKSPKKQKTKNKKQKTKKQKTKNKKQKTKKTQNTQSIFYFISKVFKEFFTGIYVF